LEEEEEEAAQCVVPLRIWRSFRSRGHSRYIYKAGRMFVLLPHVGGYVDIQQSKQEKKEEKEKERKGNFWINFFCSNGIWIVAHCLFLFFRLVISGWAFFF
jgi:hypothetical protein